MKLYVLRILAVLAVLVGIPANLFLLFLLAYFSEIPLPISTQGLSHQGRVKHLFSEGDQIIGGGYSFAEATDVWIRLRLNETPDLAVMARGTEECRPEDLTLLRTWFLKQTTNSQKSWSSLLLSNRELPDQIALNDVDNLQCRSSERYDSISHRFGKFPQGCSSSWVLYHAPSRFYYERSPCHH